VAVPEANAREAAVVEGIDVDGLKSLPQAVDLVNSPESFQAGGAPMRISCSAKRHSTQSICAMSTASKQRNARLEVACAGGHNILFIDRQSAGKTMLASAFHDFPQCRWTKLLRTRAS